MAAPIDPNDPQLLQMAGETAWQYKCRQQQLNPPTSGPNQSMSQGWRDLMINVPQAPTAWTIK